MFQPDLVTKNVSSVYLGFFNNESELERRSELARRSVLVRRSKLERMRELVEGAGEKE